MDPDHASAAGSAATSAAVGFDGAADPAAALLATVRALLSELQPGRAPHRVDLDSALDRDLGFDSLARAELLLRLEAAFGVALPEGVLAEAETPRDLLDAVARAAKVGRAIRIGMTSPLAEPAAATGSTPEAAPSLPAVLAWHADRHPERRHLLFLSSEGDPQTLSYGELQRRAAAAACALLARGLEPAQAVALMLPSGLDYFATFLGIQLAGGVPVPLYPPARKSQLEDHLRRQAAILRNARVRVLVAAPEVRALARLLAPLAPELREVTTPSDLLGAGARGPLPSIAGSDVAFLQYTSGSTGEPKGVVLTHDNLLANLRSVGRVLRLGGDDVVVSWLPLYHDMGLIGAWMGSLYFGVPLVLMSPLAFLARPVAWLQAIASHRGTISAAPNFAYALCVKKVAEEDLATLDLSSWRIALNGAEPVSAEVVEGFAARFGRCSFRREAMMPVYGLAECSLALAFTPPGRGPRIDVVERGTLQRDERAVPAADDDPRQALRLVSSGYPIPDHEVRIVDETGRELPERHQGRLQFRGPSTTRGYFRNPEATAGLLPGGISQGWLESGDLAYVADGEVFVTGRSKDLIIRAGRNLHPQELEEAVGALPGVRKGCVAVFAAAADGGTESLVVLAETRPLDPAASDELRQRITELAIDLVGTAPDEVALVPPGTVPKTSSGKLRRASARQLYESGRLARLARGGGSLGWQLLRLAGAGILPRLRRLLERGAHLAWAAWAWSLFVLLTPPVWLAVVLLPGLANRRRAARWGSRLLAAGTFSPLRIQGLERLPPGPCVVACNHQSYVDAFLLTALLPPRFAFVAKRELGQRAFSRLPLVRLGAALVDRFDAEKGTEDTRHATSAVATGDSLAVFPEGTFYRAPGLLSFRLGAFVVAAQAGVPVVPMVLRGSRSVLRAGQWLPRRGPVIALVGDPIAPPGPGWRDALALRDATRAWMLAHVAEPDLGE